MYLSDSLYSDQTEFKMQGLVGKGPVGFSDTRGSTQSLGWFPVGNETLATKRSVKVKCSIFCLGLKDGRILKIITKVANFLFNN